MYGNNLKTIPKGVDAEARLEEVRKRVLGKDGPKPGSPEDRLAYLRCEHMLVRFLIARQWNVEKAVEMLSGHYRWLADTKMDALLKDPFPEEAHIKKFYPQAYHGTDKLGRPIYIERPGYIDMPRLLQETSCERILSYVYAQSELQIRRRLPACSLVRGEVVDKSLNIMDLEGLSFRLVTHTTARKVVKDVIGMLQSHYPECSGRMIIVNAPKVFSIAWSFVKPQLDEKTIAKVSIFGSDQREAFEALLLDLVDADQLPKLFGGKCMCDGKDPTSCMRAVKGPWADLEVLKLLEEHPLDEVLTPEGAKLLVRSREAKGANEPSSSAEEKETSPSTPSQGYPQPSEDELASLPVTPLPVRTRSGTLLSEQELAKLAEAEKRVASTLEEFNRLDEVHMRTLTEWVAEFNGLVEDIGRPVIERAQGYYDSRSIWQQVVQEFANQQEVVDKVNSELEVAVQKLSTAEAAFQRFIEGKDDLREEDWQKLEPAEESDLHELQDTDPKLLRMLRVSKLADRVAFQQRQRDAAAAEMAYKRHELEEARRRFEMEDLQHANCTWNCSVKRAAPFYEKRRNHELKVDQQLSQLRNVEHRLQEAREAAAKLTGAEPASPAGSRSNGRSKSRQLDEMSLHSFEIAGGEPAQDEFLSCDEASSDDGRH